MQRAVRNDEASKSLAAACELHSICSQVNGSAEWHKVLKKQTPRRSGPFLSVFLGIIAAHRLDQDGMVG